MPVLSVSTSGFRRVRGKAPAAPAQQASQQTGFAQGAWPAKALRAPSTECQTGQKTLPVPSLCCEISFPVLSCSFLLAAPHPRIRFCPFVSEPLRVAVNVTFCGLLHKSHFSYNVFDEGSVPAGSPVLSAAGSNRSLGVDPRVFRDAVSRKLGSLRYKLNSVCLSRQKPVL